MTPLADDHEKPKIHPVPLQALIGVDPTSRVTLGIIGLIAAIIAGVYGLPYATHKDLAIVQREVAQLRIEMIERDNAQIRDIMALEQRIRALEIMANVMRERLWGREDRQR